MSTKTPDATSSDACFGRFQSVDPWNSEELIFKRRNLPHLQICGASYFVTFRSTIVLSPAARDLVLAEIRTCEEKYIYLDAAIVMPDHVHLMFRLFRQQKLSQVLRLIKGRSARHTNQLLMRQGKFWMDESFDHVIRNEAELEEKIEYMRQNPVKRGLVIQPEDYRWLFVARQALIGL
jgi:REP element-mobilizing transposase RayT